MDSIALRKTGEFMRAGRVKRACAVIIVAMFAAACNSIVDTRAHIATEARVIVTGTSPVPLTLTTSTNFTSRRDDVTGEQTYTILTSKEDTISVPLDRVFPFNDSDRFYVKLTNPSTTATAAVRLRVLVDGMSVYDQSATLKDATLKFSYFAIF